MLLHLCLVLMSATLVVARVAVLTCKRNDDCIDGYSCHKSICIKCLRCDVLLRKGNDCVMDFNECEGCLNGYEEVLITDSSNVKKPCKPVKLKTEFSSYKCANDNICPPDNYCHGQSCVKCFNCTLINRSSSDKQCVKQLHECGPCLNGFEEVAITTDTDLKLCERKTVTAVPEMPNTNVLTYATSTLMSAVLLLFIIVTVKIFIKLYKVGNQKVTKSSYPKLPSAPPLYAMDNAPQCVQKFEEQESPYIALIREQKQQAIIFKEPDAPYYNYENEINDISVPEDNPQSSVINTGAPHTSAQSDEVVCSPEIYVHNYSELRDEISVTGQPQRPNEISFTSDMNSVAVDTVDASQQAVSLAEDRMSNLPVINDSEQENNLSN